MDIVKEFLKQIPEDKATEEALLKVIDPKKARNYLILKDFYEMIKDRDIKVIDIYRKLAKKYYVSFGSVRLAVAQRRENQI